MPYINTVDINGTTYYFENLTDGNYVVDLPDLKENGTFLLQGDVEDKLNSYHPNKPLSANQGRVLNEQDKQLCSRIDDLTKSIDSKDKELDGKITDLSNSSSQKDTELEEKISTLRTEMGNNDASTLNSAKAYADEQSSAAISSANEYANTGLDKKLDKSGGKITGALEVVGALTADQKLQTKYGMTIYKRGDVSKEITAVCTGENAGKFIGKSETDLARISVATPVNNDDAATKKYVDERVGSVGGAGIDYFDVYAEVKYSYVEIMDGFYVSNCLVTATFDEIKEALDAGKTPRIIETNSLDSHSLVGGIMSLYSYDSNSFVFTGVSRSADSACGLAVIAIQADGTVMYRVAAGELPAVKDTDNGKYMLVDGGAWKAKVPPTATQSTPGLMSAKDKTKLDGLYSVEDYPVNITVPPSPVPTSVNGGIAQFTVSCDKTFDEIKSAIDAGKNVFGKYANNIWPLSYATDTMVSFAGVINFKYFEDASNASCIFTIQSNETSIITCAAGELPAPALDGSDNGKVPTVNGTRWEMKKAVVDDALSDTSTNPVQNKVVTEALDGKASTAVASQTANGLMSADDKIKLDGIEDGATKTIVDHFMSDTSTNPVQNKVVKKYIDDHDFLPEPIPNGNAVQALVVDRASRTYKLMTFDDLELPGAAESTNAPQTSSVKYLLDRKASKDAATEEADGLMSKDDKAKLNDIEDGANKTVVDEALNAASTNPVQNKAVKAALDTKAGTAVASTSANGLMSKDDKDKLDGIEDGATKTTVDAALDAASENPVQNKVVKAALDGKLSTRGGEISASLRVGQTVSAEGSVSVGRTSADTGIHFEKAASDAGRISHGSDPMTGVSPIARLKVADPTDDDDAATKKYVDGRAVRYDAAQGLTSDQKFVACANIGAVNQKGAWMEGNVALLPRGADGAFTINITPSEKSNDYTLTLDAGPENVHVYVAGIETPTDAQTDCAANVEYVKNKVSDATILTSPNGTKYKITVSDDGELSAVAVN